MTTDRERLRPAADALLAAYHDPASVLRPEVRDFLVRAIVKATGEHPDNEDNARRGRAIADRLEPMGWGDDS